MIDRSRYRFFYQVRDEDSQSVRIPGKGIFAMGRAMMNLDARYGREAQVLKWNVENHLDWNSDYISSFMSTYDNEDVTFDIAYRRKKKLGKQHVSVVVIDVWEVYGQVEFRKMRPLAKRLGIRIPNKAYNNSKHEWIFLHDIPQDAIVDVYPI